MLKSRVSKFLVLLATLTLAIVLSACGNSQSNSSTQSKTELGDKTIEIPYIASDNSTARSLVIAEVLRKLVMMLQLHLCQQVDHYMQQCSK